MRSYTVFAFLYDLGAFAIFDFEWDVWEQIHFS